MNTELSPDSRIWIYQADRTLSEVEIEQAKAALSQFCKDWTAHNKALKADYSLPYNRFIVLSVDESHTDASGCSIDKSVHFLKTLSDALNVRLFERLEMAYLKQDAIQTVHFSNLADSVKQGLIDKDTLFFNTRAETIDEFRNAFLLPLSVHWASKGINF